MISKKKEGGEESPENNAPKAPPRSPIDAEMVVYITMCLIGLPVEVQVKDGSLFSGVLHTAYFKDGHGVFLKNAKKIGKGKCDTNIAIGEIVDTLLILFDDLVQVFAKDFVPPVEGSFGNFSVNHTEAMTGDVNSQTCSRNSETEEKRLQLSASRYLGQNVSGESPSDSNENDHSMANDKQNLGEVAIRTSQDVHEAADIGEDCISLAKDGEQSMQPVVSSKGRQIKCMAECQEHGDLLDKMAHEGLHLSPSSNANGVRCTSPASPPAQRESPDSIPALTNLPSSDAAVSALSASNSSSDSRASSNASRSTSPDTPVPEKRTVGSISIKESKLNPSAKIFTPSIARFQPVSSATPTIISPEYTLNNFPAMTISGPQLGLEMSSFAHHSSAQNKIVLCNNLVTGQNDVGAQNARPVLGNANIRQQPVRFNGQYHPVQVGTPCMNPLPETVMVGRLGQLVYMNPVPQDAIQGMPVISQELSHSLLTPYQANLPKLQGHAMPLSVTPTIMAGGNQTVLVPSFSQPFSSGRPIVVHSGTGYFNCKYQ